MSAETVYVIVGAVAWALLVWPDAAKAQRLAEALARRRDALLAVSLAGTVVRAVGVTLLLIGGIETLAAPAPGLPGRAIRLVAVGAVLLIGGWMARLVAWVMWKRRHRDLSA